MRHGDISKTTVKGLVALRERIAKANIPSSILDESINIASWNIRDFGKTPRRPESLHYIAEILHQFDLIAITEVRDDIGDLVKVLSILGPYWKAVFSDFLPDPGGNRERVAYIYDKRAVEFTGLASEAEAPRKKVGTEYLPTINWWRSPFMASFRSGSFDFILLAAHIRWGESVKAREAALLELAKWVEIRQSKAHIIDKDLIVMGDFNIPKENDRLFKALTSRGLSIPEALRGIQGTNLARDKRYDQILYLPGTTNAFTNRGGAVDFYDGEYQKLYPRIRMTKRQFTWQISVHLPLWMQLNVDNDHEILDQALR